MNDYNTCISLFRGEVLHAGSLPSMPFFKKLISVLEILRHFEENIKMT